MAIENIYYLDQFTNNIIKTDSDKITSIVVEDVSSLAGTETLINLQVGGGNFYLFGDTAEVYTRPVSGGTWNQILGPSEQAGLLILSNGPLNITDSKVRCPFVTDNGNIYIAYNQVDGADPTNFNVSILYYNGITWTLLTSIDKAQFVGFADLFDSTIALKTTDATQNFSHCNKLTVIQGNSIYTIPAPTTGVRPLVSSLHDTTVSLEGSNNTILYQTVLPSGEIIILTTAHLLRIATDFTVSSYPMVATALSVGTYGQAGTITGNYLVFYTRFQASQYAHQYAVIDLSSNTMTHTGVWTTTGASIVVSVGLNNNTVLVMTNHASGNCYLFDPVANTLTATTAFVNTSLNSLTCSYIQTSTNDIIMSIYGKTGFVYFNITNATWTVHVPTPALLGTNPFYVLGDGTFMVAISGYHFGVYNPSTFAITKTITLTPNSNDLDVPNIVAIYPDFAVSDGNKVHFLSSFYHCIYTFDATGTGTYSRLEFVDLQHSTLPALNLAMNISLIDSNTLRMKFIDPNTGRVNSSSVSFTLADNIPAVSNIQAVAGISLNELYCVSLKGFSDGVFIANGGIVGTVGRSDFGSSGTYFDPNGLDITSYIYKWNGSSWSVLHTISEPRFNLSIHGNPVQYFPYLMSSSYNALGVLELVMIRNTPDSVFLYKNGVLTGAVMQAVPGNENVYNGSTAPSIPIVANSDFSATCALADSVVDGPGTPDMFTYYAQARLVYRTDLGLYCLIRNNEFYYVSRFPADYSQADLIGKANSSFYLTMPIITDSPVPLTGDNIGSDPHLALAIQSMSNTEMKVKIDIHSANNLTGPMYFNLGAAINGAYTSPSAATQTLSFLIPPTPALKYFPVLPGQTPDYNKLFVAGNKMFCTSSTTVAVSTSRGHDWSVVDTIIPPAYNTSGSNWSINNPIIAMCDNGPSGIAIATSIVGTQTYSDYWKPATASATNNTSEMRVSVRRMVYNGSTYIALLGPQGDDYTTYIGQSTDLSTFTLFTDSNDNAYVNPDPVYYAYSTGLCLGGGGLTLAALGSLVLRIDSSNILTLPTGVIGPQSNGNAALFATDYSTKWLMYTTDSFYSSSDSGHTWTDIGATITGIYAGHGGQSTTTPLFIEYVDTYFVIVGNVPSNNQMNTIKSTNVNFSSSVSFYANTLTFDNYGCMKVDSTGLHMIMSTRDHVVISDDFGQSWSGNGGY